MNLYAIIISLIFLTQLHSEDRKFDFDKIEKKLLESDDFSEEKSIESLPWTQNHGTWKIVEGKLTGEKIEAENHSANISLNHKLPKNYLFTYQFKLTKGGNLDCSILGSGGGKGLRVRVSENDIYLRVKGGTGILDWDVAKLDTEKWHTLKILILDDIAIASINGEATVYGKHEKIGLTKKRFSIGTGNKGNFVDNVKTYFVKAKLSEKSKKLIRSTPWL